MREEIDSIIEYFKEEAVIECEKFKISERDFYELVSEYYNVKLPIEKCVFCYGAAGSIGWKYGSVSMSVRQEGEDLFETYTMFYESEDDIMLKYEFDSLKRLKEEKNRDSDGRTHFREGGYLDMLAKIYPVCEFHKIGTLMAVKHNIIPIGSSESSCECR